jgi:hypothetical protein
VDVEGKEDAAEEKEDAGGGSGDCETLYKNNCKSLGGWWVEQDSESTLRG